LPIKKKFEHYAENIVLKKEIYENIKLRNIYSGHRVRGLHEL